MSWSGVLVICYPLPLLPGLAGLSEGWSGWLVVACAVAVGVCWFDVVGVVFEVWVCACGVDVVEVACVWGVWWCGVVDWLAAEVAGGVVFCVLLAELLAEFFVCAGFFEGHGVLGVDMGKPPCFLAWGLSVTEFSSVVARFVNVTVFYLCLFVSI